MTWTERVAREICWREFAAKPSRKAVGLSKTEYWKRVSETSKEGYTRDAKFLLTILPRLPEEMVKKLIASTVR